MGPTLLDGRPVQARFAVYAEPSILPADGWDTPTGLGGNRALSNGRVEKVTPTSVTLWSVAYENHRRTFVRTTHSNFRPSATLSVGGDVKRGQPLGDGRAQVAMQMRPAGPLERTPEANAASAFRAIPDVVAFTKERRRLFDPSTEEQLILVDKDAYAMQVRERGRVVVEIDIGYGQKKGRKRLQGDLKTPTGMYFVVDKKRKEFGGKWGAYFGGHWIKVNYPNAYDARWGEANGFLTRKQRRGIAKAWARRRLTNQGTKLGGGIGFHGWIGTRTTREDWSEDDPHQTWGCILLHNVDIAAHFDRVKEGAMVVLF